MEVKTIRHTPWPAIWIWIMLSNIVLGIFAPTSQILMFIRIGGVILCFIYSLIYFRRDHLLHLALLATVAADIFLASDNISDFGLLCFLLAQIIHLLRLCSERAKTPIFILALGIIVLVFLNNLLQFMPQIFLVCGIYFILLCTNTGISWRWWRQDRQKHQETSNLFTSPAFCAALGFSLFIACDLCIAMSYFALTQVFSSFFYAPANFLAWFFYYPSQILVSNSSKYVTMDSKGR